MLPFPGNGAARLIHQAALLYSTAPSQLTLFDIKIALSQQEKELSPEEFASLFSK